MNDYTTEERAGGEAVYIAYAREHHRQHPALTHYVAFIDITEEEQDCWAAAYRAARLVPQAPVSPRFTDPEAETRVERANIPPPDPLLMAPVHRKAMETEPGHLDTVSYQEAVPALASAVRLFVKGPTS